MARCYHSDRKKEGKIEFLLKIIIDFEKDFNSLEECGQNVVYIYIYILFLLLFFFLSNARKSSNSLITMVALHTLHAYKVGVLGMR